jgi:hypothetical protein
VYISKYLITEEYIYKTFIKHYFANLVFSTHITDLKIVIGKLFSKLLKKIQSDNLEFLHKDDTFNMICRTLKGDDKKCVSNYFKDLIFDTNEIFEHDGNILAYNNNSLNAVEENISNEDTVGNENFYESVDKGDKGVNCEIKSDIESLNEVEEDKSNKDYIINTDTNLLTEAELEDVNLI